MPSVPASSTAPKLFTVCVVLVGAFVHGHDFSTKHDAGRGELWNVGGDAVSSVLEQSGLSSCSLTIYSDLDTTSAHISRVRQRSWCSVVVVVSESKTFLATLANWSLKGRLLVWASRLLVVTRLTLPHLNSLLSSHWTFSMMNTVFLNLEQPRPNLR
ncbi:hypothetical protein Pmani_004529 [Petrolisthes manimaculis]|uniref:Uncharacterized protein n=1 Tax=Petrolisthes manimaculis TaxID=1843537 RepID=A0AAE1QDJ8_9EUCA|nr:hypothetical protein Pmani_004529 [Petrolisthes manimaculis]